MQHTFELVHCPKVDLEKLNINYSNMIFWEKAKFCFFLNERTRILLSIPDINEPVTLKDPKGLLTMNKVYDTIIAHFGCKDPYKKDSIIHTYYNLLEVEPIGFLNNDIYCLVGAFEVIKTIKDP